MRILTIAVCIGALAACDNPQRAQEKADKAQTQADDDKAKAQAEADRKQAAATEELTKSKSSYRNTFTDLLADIDKRTADLNASRLTAKATDLPDLDKKLANLASLRTTIVSDMKELDAATAAGWDQLRDQFDKDTTSCRAALMLGKT
jgi:uncharacterized membrane protein YqiK